MRFESVLWAVLALLLVGSGAVSDTAVGTEEQYSSADGGNEVPPPTTKP
jgi:hypothetical protein